MNPGEVKCPRCGGKGQVGTSVAGTPKGAFDTVKTLWSQCSTCAGHGSVTPYKAKRYLADADAAAACAVADAVERGGRP